MIADKEKTTMSTKDATDVATAENTTTIVFGETTAEPETNTNEADVYVVESFVNEWDDDRVKLAGETYEAKEAIKSDWDNLHHKPGKDKSGNFVWVVDGDDDALDILEAALEDAGFTFDAEVDPIEETPNADPALDDLVAAANENDEITVHYNMKNRENADNDGDRENDHSGVIFQVRGAGEDVWGRPEEPCVAFRRDDGGPLRVRPDDNGTPSLFSSGYHPYMGDVTKVELTHK